MKKFDRRLVVAGLLFLSAGARPAWATPASKDRNAARIHERRNIERRQEDLIRQEQGRIEQQRSRPVPPTNPSSRVVPNR